MTDKQPPDEAFHLTGDRLGKFVILSELGRGSMGVVYEALQEDLKRKVALKILPANITLDAKQVRRFHREAESVARLRHDNIIQIYEVGQVGGTHYFAMELVDGRPLDAEPGRDRESVLRAARVARDAARGLAHAHERGVIHRDVKPGNLLVDRSGRVVVTDFGLARLTDSASLTSTDAIVGTPKYMSPEQILAHASRPVDHRADIYSLGATLYHITTGRPPFDEPTVQAFIKAILEQRPVSPRRHNRQIPYDLATIVLRCLEKDPAERYQNAAELADDIDRFLAGERIHAKPKGLLAIAFETVRRHQIVAILGVVAALALGLTLFLLGVTAEESRRAELEETLRSIAEIGDADLAVLEIEKLARQMPGHEGVRSLRARLYQRRAMRTLEGLEPHFAGVVEDLERAGLAGTFWHLMILLEADRAADARSAAEALPAEDPLRRLTFARIALLEERHDEVLSLLAEPARIPGQAEATVYSALTRGLAHRARGEGAEAVAYLRVASDESAGIPEAWLRTRALYAFYQVGGDVRDFLSSIIGRTFDEPLRALSRIRERMSSDEYRLVERFEESALALARQERTRDPAALESAALARLDQAQGAERATALIVVAIARIGLGRPDGALAALDQAQEESTPSIDPYLYWARSLAWRVQGESAEALEAAMQAVDLALAGGGGFADLRYLFEYTALLSAGAPPEDAGRADDFLRARLSRPPPDAGPWVSELLRRLSSARAPPR